MTAIVLTPTSWAARRRRIAGVVLRDLAAMRRSPVRVFEIFFWPTVNLVVWGFVTRYLQATHVPFAVAMLLGAAVLWELLHRASTEVGLGFLEDIWSRNLLNVFASPLSLGEYLTGLVVFSLAKVVLATVLTGLIAWLGYGFGVFSIGVGLIPFMALLLVMGWALAIVAISCVLRFGEGAQVLGWSLAFILQPFAGVFYPLSVLPGPFRAVAYVVPASHVFEGMRAVLAGQGVPWGDLGVAALLDVVYLAAAVWLFTVTLRNARMKGRLSRFGE
jgi:ABC-2 type transport system permease protein